MINARELRVHDDELVPVFNARNSVDAMLYRVLLEEAGIRVLSRPLGHYSVVSGARHIQLCINASDAPLARELLQAYQQQVASGAFNLDVEDEAEDEE